MDTVLKGLAIESAILAGVLLLASVIVICWPARRRLAANARGAAEGAKQ